MTVLKLDKEISIQERVPDSPDSPSNNADRDRVAFLSSFTPEEDKAIMRKVDCRFLWVIGLMYTLKNVRTRTSLAMDILTNQLRLTT